MQDHRAANHPDLLVGISTSDDAGVYRLAPHQALVQTVDFFTPVVDDPYQWGRIAAANALSDVYAMGGTPLTALQMIGWPRDQLDFALAGEVIAGGADVMAEAGCTIVGGHSIDDTEPKYGFAVTGLVSPERVISNAGARVGDRLVLTKPIGTGIIATAIKRQACPAGVIASAVEWMTTLNREAAQAMVEVGAGAATDVTGFGLLGHLGEIMAASGVGARLDSEAVPVIEGAWDLLDAGMYPGGSVRNLAAVQPLLDTGRGESRMARMLADAQTSGGLLIAVRPHRLEALLSALTAGGVDGVVIGEVVEGNSISW